MLSWKCVLMWLSINIDSTSQPQAGNDPLGEGQTEGC